MLYTEFTVSDLSSVTRNSRVCWAACFCLGIHKSLRARVHVGGALLSTEFCGQRYTVTGVLDSRVLNIWCSLSPLCTFYLLTCLFFSVIGKMEPSNLMSKLVSRTAGAVGRHVSEHSYEVSEFVFAFSFFASLPKLMPTHFLHLLL